MPARKSNNIQVDLDMPVLEIQGGWHGSGSTLHEAGPKSKKRSNIPRFRGCASSCLESNGNFWKRGPSGSRTPKNMLIFAHTSPDL
jgi:hypothetical protein